MSHIAKRAIERLRRIARRFRPMPPPANGLQSAAGTDPVAEMIPEHSIAGYVGGTAEQFRIVGEQNVRQMRELAGLQPTERVLEVGCGIGRIAIALTQYLDGGSYVGFDIVPHGIEWCRTRILGSLLLHGLRDFGRGAPADVGDFGGTQVRRYR
jgi:SAM-dependent methyltransferase